MPIKRKLAKEFDTSKRIMEMALEAVRLVKQPLTYNGWKNVVSKDLEIDMDSTVSIVNELITYGYLNFVQNKGKEVIYMSDRTPEFFRWLVGKETFK